MKTLALLLAFSFSVHAQDITDEQLDAIPKAAIIQTLKHLQSIARESGARADSAELFLSEQRDRFTFIQTQLATAQTSAAALEKHDADMTEQKNKETLRAEKESARANLQTKLAWKWRLISFGIVAAVVALFIFKQWLKTIPIIGPIIKAIL